MALNDQHAMAPIPSAAPPTIHETIAADARELSAKLHAHRMKLFPPKARKNLRRFTSGEVAKLVGINDGYLRQLSLEGRGPQPDTSPSGRRSYTFEDNWRDFLATAAVVRSMLGISPSAWEEAQTVLGETQAAVVVACILQRGTAIRSAGGYLRGLTRKAEVGEFSLGPILMSQINSRLHEKRRA